MKIEYLLLLNEVKGEIPNISNLATKTAFNAIEKKKYLVLVIKSRKAEYNTKINEIEKKSTDHNHDKYIATPEFDKLTSESFAARLKQANITSKNDIANFVNKNYQKS